MLEILAREPGQLTAKLGIRLLNQDIIDLAKRVPKGSRVVVLGPEQSGKGEI